MMTAKDIPCYAIYSGDFHYSSEWGNKMAALWIATKRALVNREITLAQFRDVLVDGIIDKADWRADFDQAARDVGADPTDDVLFEEYVAINRSGALDLLPHTLHAEFCWVPEWDGVSLDTLIDTHGLESERSKSNYIEDVLPGNWLAVFLKLVNQSSDVVIRAAQESHGTDGRKFADKCHKARFRVEKDPTRPSLMTGEQVITAIENAYWLAVPTFHCEINVRALFEHDPSKAMRVTAADGKVHLGFHNFINGAGYMDCYAGQVTIPADATGFAGVERWDYGIDEVYGLVKSYFRTTPIAA